MNNFTIMIFGIIVFIISGSLVVSFLPEAISFSCFTENQHWVENGTRYIGNQVECP